MMSFAWNIKILVNKLLNFWAAIFVKNLKFIKEMLGF